MTRNCFVRKAGGKIAAGVGLGCFVLAAWAAAPVFSSAAAERPLRYTPVGTDFVITNGAEFFNRPLYSASRPFRVDAGDKPEFSLYLPGRGGNLRFGIKTRAGAKWLNDADQIVARYRPGSMVYEIKDALLAGSGELRLTALPLRAMDGLVLRAELSAAGPAVQLVWAFGGANGMKGRRNGDIGCETEPVAKFFQLRPDQCRGDVFTIATNTFFLRGKSATIRGVASPGARLAVADANHWPDAAALLASAGGKIALPVLVGTAALDSEKPLFLVLHPISDGRSDETLANLETIFADAEEARRVLAGRVMVETPDPFINAAAAALNVAADAVWDEAQESFMHGAVAWRQRLLGWRGPYAGDELGWHERTAEHFAGFANGQNTEPIPAALPAPEASAHLARNETALHSNGDLTKSHYDMNLVAVDVFFRHLLWTGDLEYARKMWPVIERHLAWERRLFRREFGAEKLPLYEAYCCIWASDDLAYNGGGAAHSSAYNLYHNRLAARVARLLGKDAAPYEREADLIARGLKENLWLADRGWFGEWKDWLGLQLVHPNAALWTFYHTVDSEVPTALEAWQMSRFVDTQLAHIPLLGPGVPDGCFTLPTTSWMPYTWSLNNVVLAETMHTALAYWQAGRADGAFPLFKGAVLDSMFLGLCPGNVGMCTFFDANRRESQRDFADGVGAMSRSLVEGLFGVQPDLLAGEIKIAPGFPAEWNRASLRHPDFKFAYQRHAARETYSLESRFGRPLKLRLQIPARQDAVASLTVNGQPVPWRVLEDSVGTPRLEITVTPATEQQVVVEWSGKTFAPAGAEFSVPQNSELRHDLDAKPVALADPQGALSAARLDGGSLRGLATGRPGHRTIFARVEQESFQWWRPVTFEILPPHPNAAPLDWRRPVGGHLETIPLGTLFNDRVTRIFRNDYRAPRSPFASLATPVQGIGSWCHPQETFDVDDSGLRAAAAQAGGQIRLPNGVPLATPGVADVNNIAFVSQWDNYPRELAVPLVGKAARVFLLMAGSTSAMQSRFDNGEVLVTYAAGPPTRLALHNPTSWWPIDQDYFIDDFAFARPEPLPPRVDLKTGRVRLLEMNSFRGRGRKIPGGAATVLELPLDSARDLQSLTVRALANEVVIGLMSVTLER